MRILKGVFGTLAAVAVLIVIADYTTYAATGGSFILGKTNRAGAVSVLKRTTAGPALQLNTTSSSAAPFTTNARGKVTNLNADKLDGLDSAALTTVPYVFTRQITTPTSSFAIDAPVAAGSYLVSYTAGLNSSPNASLVSLDCFVSQYNGTTTVDVAEDFEGAAGTYAAASGAGFVTKTAGTGHKITLKCLAGATFVSFDSGSGETVPVQLVLVPVNGAHKATF